MTNPPQSPFPKGEVSPPFEKGRREGFGRHFVFLEYYPMENKEERITRDQLLFKEFIALLLLLFFCFWLAVWVPRSFVPAGRRDAASRGDRSGPLDLRRPADLAALFPSPCRRSCLSPGRTPLPGPIAPGGENQTPPRPDANSFRPPPTGRNRPYPLWSFPNKMIRCLFF